LTYSLIYSIEILLAVADI